MATYGGGFTSRGGLNSRGQDHVQIRVDPGSKFDFDSEVDGLRAGVRRLKDLSLAIEKEQKEQGELINSLEDTMERAKIMMKSAMGRMNIAYRQAKSNHMLFLVLFAVFLFFSLYVMAKIYRVGRMVLGG